MSLALAGYGDKEWRTHVVVDGEEGEYLVEYYTSQDEPDVNYIGGVDYISVSREGFEFNLADVMSKDELIALEDRIIERENEMGDPSNDPRY
jgi:hypothetical protein